MVALSNMWHNFEMPIDGIVYARTGGCFISYRRSAVILTTLLLLLVGVGFLAFQIAHRLQERCPESLLHFIESPASNSEQTISSSSLQANVSVKNYQLSMQPVFNRSIDSGPFTSYGSVRITFTPIRNEIYSVPVQIASSLLVPENSVFVYRSRIWSDASFATDSNSGDGLHWVGEDDGDDIDDDAVATNELLPEVEDADIVTIDVVDNQTEDDAIHYDSSAGKNRLARQFTEIAVTAVVLDPLQDTLTIKVALPLKPGHFYVVKMGFAGSMGLSSGFQCTGYEGGMLGGTLTESLAGSLSFPWIRTGEKVTFDLDIRRPVTMKSLASARLFRTQPVDPDNAIDVYQRSAPMDSHEFAFAVHELHTIEVQSAVSVLLRPMLAAGNQTIAELAISEVLQRFRRLTGLRSVGTLRLVLVPKMRDSWYREANGLIFLNEQFVAGRAESKARLGRLVFRNMLRSLAEVQPNNWFDEVFPMFANPSEELDAEQRMKAMRPDADNVEVIQSKGVALLKTITQLISPNTFATALREYFKSRLDGRNRDIIDIIQRSIDNMTINTEFVQLVNMWQSFQQYPILSVDKHSTVKLTTINGTSEEQNWIGPVEFITAKHNDSESGWKILKRQPTDYFRVNYEQSNWLAILLAIERNDPRISAIERASIADDIFSLVQCGLANYTLVVRLIDVWTAGQMGFIEWKPVVDNLQMLLEAAVESENYPVFYQYVHDEITITFRQMHQSPLHANSKLMTLITSLACCTLSIPECRAPMQLEFARALAKTSNLTSSSAANVLDLSETYTTLCATLKSNPLWSTWSVIRNAIGRIDDAPFNRMLIQALSCSEQLLGQKALVALLRNSTLRTFRADIYAAASRNIISRLLVLERLLEEPAIDQLELEDLSPLLHSLSTKLELRLLESWFAKLDGHQDHTYWSGIVTGIRRRIAWSTRLQQELPAIAVL